MHIVNLHNAAEAEGCILRLTLEQFIVNYYIDNEKSTILTLLGGDGKYLIEKREVQWFSMTTWRKDVKEDEDDGCSLASETITGDIDSYYR
uniref:Uncharacterized protein n=1 Tax=Oryza punctata TaxID=4537 RepID=A0A0E0LVA7_ORYPU